MPTKLTYVVASRHPPVPQPSGLAGGSVLAAVEDVATAHAIADGTVVLTFEARRDEAVEWAVLAE